MHSLLFVALLASVVPGATHVNARLDSMLFAINASIVLPTTVEGFLIIEASDGDVDAFHQRAAEFGLRWALGATSSDFRFTPL